MSAALAALIPAKATNAVVVKMSFFIEVLPLWGRRVSPLSFDTLPDDTVNYVTFGQHVGRKPMRLARRTAACVPQS
jgi:hypothetical protein